ncbi:hypothetical protein KI387_023156 [Taxus chinensis]|uniref:peroxidase n=1 Tax=Taxus chinensis TaxID=29808 RepID=A0AA38G1L3_TAXCH|nr:hypothetical protein KI387_023156 [Taxus chinensis]
MGASLLRLHFHDCFVNGCDGSLLLDDSSTITGEKTATPNNNSVRGFDVVDTIKSKVEAICSGIVSCADILAIVARDSVVQLGGPTWTVQLGRRDSKTASRSDANAKIPGPRLNLSGLISSFSGVGLSTRDMIALSGAHTIGQARCTNFRTHIYNETNINTAFATSLKANCPTSGGDNNLSPFDVQTANVFDNDYYKNLRSQKGLLHSDQELFNGGSTDSQVTTYSSSQKTFFTNFGSAMVNMGNISPLTGGNGPARSIRCAKGVIWGIVVLWKIFPQPHPLATWWVTRDQISGTIGLNLPPGSTLGVFGARRFSRNCKIHEGFDCIRFATKACSMLIFARLCINVPMGYKVPKRIVLDSSFDYWEQRNDIESSPIICNKCRMVGYEIKNCCGEASTAQGKIEEGYGPRMPISQIDDETNSQGTVDDGVAVKDIGEEMLGKTLKNGASCQVVVGVGSNEAAKEGPSNYLDGDRLGEFAEKEGTGDSNSKLKFCFKAVVNNSNSAPCHVVLDGKRVVVNSIVMDGKQDDSLQGYLEVCLRLDVGTSHDEFFVGSSDFDVDGDKWTTVQPKKL